jgi:Family of unknown function (DUF6348)
MASAWQQASAEPADGQNGARTREILTLVAERMRTFGGEWPATAVTGPLLKGPGTVGIVLRDNHTELDAHLDLDFVLNVDRPAETTISDCVTGFGETARDAWRQGIDTWAGLTAATVVEMLRPANEFAQHHHGDDPLGFLGWHSISAGFTGFGLAEPGLLAQWAFENDLVPRLRPAIVGGLDREHLNGVKILFGGVAGDEVAEVRINNACGQS